MVATQLLQHTAATIGAHRARADVWQPIRRDPQTYTLNASGNRVVRLVRRGLPTGLSVGATELLAGKIQLRLMVSSGGNDVLLRVVAGVTGAGVD